MSIEIKVPVFPESVADGLLTSWHKKPGDSITQDEVIADIETDKVVFEVPSLANGIVEKILVEEGATVVGGQVIATINEQAIVASKITEPTASEKTSAENKTEVESDTPFVTPSANKLIKENNLNVAGITASGKGGRVLKEDVLTFMQQDKPVETIVAANNVVLPDGPRPQKRVPMTRLRARIAERLLQAQQTAAILTTFNEVNMQPVIDLRKKYRDDFEKKHGVRLGFMSFFVKAVVEALKQFPSVNASVEDNDVIYHGFFDIGIAVGSPRGLVVPILRDAEQMSMPEIEQNINNLGELAKTGKLSIEQITGGTFSITNGGVFGSMLSTPILNPPQSAILGMHKIEPRPIAENGQVVIRPMMYVALSYDHRIIDGREAVQFLVMVKDLLEYPGRMLLDI